MNIAVLAGEGSWHFKDLLRAAGSRHSIVSVAFDDLCAGLNAGETTFHSQSQDLQRFDRVIVRTMPAGSLQQVIFRMDLLWRLQRSGVKIVNSPSAIEISVDKYRSLSRIAEAGVAVPPTMVAESLVTAIECFRLLGGDVVYKPLFGSMGRGIERLSDANSAESFFKRKIDEGQILYLQKFIDHRDWDIRILILGSHIFAIRRCRKGHWLTNVSQGAVATAYDPTEHESEIARTAASATGCEIAGVDLFYDAVSGELMVCDVNAAPGWRGVSEALATDVGSRYLNAVCDAARG